MSIMLYLFDVDGTLRKPVLLRPLGSLARWDQRILPGRIERLNQLRRGGHRLGAASNQGLVGFGLVSERRAARIMEETNRRLNGLLEWIRICPHHPMARRSRYRIRCSCRKPNPGMLLEALDYFLVQPADAVYVGDREIDRQAAAAAGFQYQPAELFFQRPMLDAIA